MYVWLELGCISCHARSGMVLWQSQQKQPSPKTDSVIHTWISEELPLICSVVGRVFLVFHFEGNMYNYEHKFCTAFCKDDSIKTSAALYIYSFRKPICMIVSAAYCYGLTCYLRVLNSVTMEELSVSGFSIYYITLAASMNRETC
ncbi:unnamed protein product [Linum tenue]|uniref:Uncharacterized protein n=1 Tax=Linum tenue TaxID=586396 RepID=A0AAV0H254_9ROSI|nr:unnamed protein product [Linum tenue]